MKSAQEVCFIGDASFQKWECGSRLDCESCGGAETGICGIEAGDEAVVGGRGAASGSGLGVADISKTAVKRRTPYKKRSIVVRETDSGDC